MLFRIHRFIRLCMLYRKKISKEIEALKKIPLLAYYTNSKNWLMGTSLEVQWLRLWTSTAGSMGSIPCQGTKILQAMWRGQKKKKRKKKPKIKTDWCVNCFHVRDGTSSEKMPVMYWWILSSKIFLGNCL